MDYRRNRRIWFRVDRSGSIAIKCFLVIGKSLLWISFSLVAVAVFTLVGMVILDAWILEDDMRQRNLEAKGFILKVPAVYKKNPHTIECTQRGQHKDCPYTKNGEVKLEQIK